MPKNRHNRKALKRLKKLKKQMKSTDEPKPEKKAEGNSMSDLIKMMMQRNSGSGVQMIPSGTVQDKSRDLFQQI
jgi:hypothetical protein